MMRFFLFLGLSTILVTLSCSTEGTSEGASEEESAPAAASNTVWSIGLYSGASIFQLEDPPQIENPILTFGDVSDIEATVIAHPFFLKTDGRYYLFFTAKNRESDAGEIALVDGIGALP